VVNEVEVSKLRLARQGAGLTLEELAEKTELTAAYLSQLETFADWRPENQPQSKGGTH
jgi:hypothetical protein